MLVRLLYVSRALSPEAANATESILDSARKYNSTNGITGILCFGGGLYLQAVEGGRVQVNELYSHIVRDPRHRDVVLLDYQEISERRFGGWTMGQVNLAKLNTSIVLKYSEKPELDPYAVSGTVSLALLEELMLTASIIGRA
ncbi:MAG: blue light sensor protein [Alcaligenaceae bacterium]|nr:MAG: blue light sensor protein [Alcaligenaceae bacterium]